MDQTMLLVVMTVFVIIAAIALCIQAGMLFGLNKKTKEMHDQIAPLVPKVELLVKTTQSTVEQSRQQLADITARATEILTSAKNQMAIIEEVVTDGAARAKVEMERVEMVLDDTISRAHETVATVHTGIMRPLREISGLTAGLRAALAYLARSSRPSVDRATSDEEMFI